MIKKLARKVLETELNMLRGTLTSLTSNEIRLNELVNSLSKDNQDLRAKRPYREYNFTPESLTSQEQGIVNDFLETPIIELITKWLKIKADQNNDLLLHSASAKEEHKNLWRLAVLMYDDWNQFLKHCSRVNPE